MRKRFGKGVLADPDGLGDVSAEQLRIYGSTSGSVRSRDELDGFVRKPEWVDRQGKLRLVNGKITVAFGRNKGRTLEYLAREEPDYLRWMIQNEVVPDAMDVLRDALLVDIPKS